MGGVLFRGGGHDTDQACERRIPKRTATIELARLPKLRLESLRAGAVPGDRRRSAARAYTGNLLTMSAVVAEQAIGVTGPMQRERHVAMRTAPRLATPAAHEKR